MRWMVFVGFLGLATSGCAFVERHATGMADQFKPNQCRTETARYAPSYSTTGAYRCVGEGCQDYGCGER